MDDFTCPDHFDHCPRCGALVDPELQPFHRAWHDALEEQLSRIGAYVPPPTYGGR